MTDQIAQMPPHSKDAQRSVLGAMLRDNHVVPDVCAVIDASDFYGDADSLIFTAIVDLRREDKPADLVTVAMCLESRKTFNGTQFQEVGGAAYIGDLWDAAPVVGNAVAYAQEIRATSTMRRLIHAGTEIQRLGFQRDGTPPEELAARAASLIADIQERQHRDGLVHISVAVDEALMRLDRRRGMSADGQCEGGITTPWAALNNLIVSLNAGDMCIVAARPSVGKTLFGLNMIDFATRQGHRTMFASIEQGRTDIVDRLLSQGSNVNSSNFRSGVFNDVEAEAVQHFASKLKGRPLHIDDSPVQSVARIMAQASKLKRREGLDFLVVDYMGLVEPERRDANANERISAISKGLKQIARHLEIPLMCLCQLNRNSEIQGRKPKLSDLRDSGGIEQDADTVMFLHKNDPMSEAPEHLLEVIVGKQRNGPVGELKLMHRKATYRIEDLPGGFLP